MTSEFRVSIPANWRMQWQRYGLRGFIREGVNGSEVSLTGISWHSLQQSKPGENGHSNIENPLSLPIATLEHDQKNNGNGHGKEEQITIRGDIYVATV